MDTEVHLCECGCGTPTSIAKVNYAARGYVKGQPLRFVQRHHRDMTRFREDGTQRCSLCQEYKPRDQFAKGQYRCTPCAMKANAEWRAKNPGKHQDGVRFRRLRWMHGIDPDTFRRMMAEQGGVCKICRRPERHPRRDGSPRALCVDHDHKTGRVRGLLCLRCNHLLGHMGDDPANFQRAIDYLTQNSPV